MIMINEQWYNPKDLDDVSEIIREQFDYNLADIIDELLNSKDREIQELRDDVAYWENEYNRKYRSRQTNYI